MELLLVDAGAAVNRRSFLASILAAGVAPAVVKASVLMPIRPTIIVPTPKTVMALNDPAAMEKWRRSIELAMADRFDRQFAAVMGRIGQQLPIILIEDS